MSVRVEPCAKRVRVLLGGTVVADTYAPKLVWDDRPYPTYYFPDEDVRLELLHETGPSEYAVEVGQSRGRARRRADAPELARYIRFDWGSMDEWLEEDEPIYTHARDPHSRVDVLASSRHVVITLDGVVLADTRQPRLLFETGLPVRFYIPMADVALDRLIPSDTVTHCPYKGQASYWSARVGGRVIPDVAWMYRYPLPESVKVAGLVAFYPDKTSITVDGGIPPA